LGNLSTFLLQKSSSSSSFPLVYFFIFFDHRLAVHRGKRIGVVVLLRRRLLPAQGLWQNWCVLKAWARRSSVRTFSKTLNYFVFYWEFFWQKAKLKIENFEN
jgi:hypothetical protein